MTNVRSLASLAKYSNYLEDPETWQIGQALASENPGIFVDEDGRTVAKFLDAEWPNPATGKTWRWNPDGKDGCSLYPEGKVIMFHILFHPDFCEREQSTVTTYYYWVRLLCRQCEKADFPSISHFFSDDRAMQEIVDQMSGERGETAFVRHAVTIIRMLFRIDEQILGFAVTKGPAYAKLLSSASAKNRDGYQHPPIPWRLYRHLIGGIAKKLEECLQVLDMDEWAKVLQFHQEKGSQKSGTGGGRTGRFIEHELPSLADYAKDFPSVRNTLTNMLDIARIGVMVFTGCRTGETLRLEPDPPDDRGNGVYLLYGRASKTAQNDTYWVTNAAGANAIRLALKVREVLSVGLGLESRLSELPLFPSFLNFPTNLFEERTREFHHGDTSMTGVDKVLRDAGIEIPVMNESDMQFLLDLSVDSKINLQKFRVGKPHRITSHQFRRSLVYFAMRSGDIEIGAFRLQFKHLLTAMTEYYSSGVDGLDGATNHTMSELIELEHFAEIDERLRRHIAGFDRLAGGVGALIKKNALEANKDRLPLVLDRTRDQLLRRAKQGEIRYSRTPLGACTSVKPCLSRAQADVSACLGCRSAVLQIDKVKSVHDALISSSHPFFSSQSEHFSHFLLGQEES